jgi:putative DNA primase/helicase
MRQSVTQGESEYLQSKGLTGFNYPLMPDGSLLLELVDESGAVAAAQTITPQGEKRLLTGSAKRGAYHAVNAPEQPQSVLIAEGLATALSVHLMRPDALTVAAIDAGNLLPVAEVMRRKYQQRKLSSPQITTTSRTNRPTRARRPQRKPPYPWLAGWRCRRQTIKPTGTTTTSKTGWKPLQPRLTIRCTRFRGCRETTTTGH